MRDGRRFPRWVFGLGSEPDPRFSLANERTLLAWIRTALALIASGVALEALAVPLDPTLRLAAATLLLVLGLVVPPLAWLTWGVVERAMRRGSPLPATYVAPVVGAGASAVALLLLLGFAIQ